MYLNTAQFPNIIKRRVWGETVLTISPRMLSYRGVLKTLRWLARSVEVEIHLGEKKGVTLP